VEPVRPVVGGGGVLCKRVLEKGGGTESFERRKGEGTRFGGIERGKEGGYGGIVLIDRGILMQWSLAEGEEIPSIGTDYLRLGGAERET